MSILVPISKFAYLLLDEEPVQHRPPSLISVTQLVHGPAYVFKPKMPESNLGYILSQCLDSEAGMRSLDWPLSLFENSLDSNGIDFFVSCFGFLVVVPPPTPFPWLSKKAFLI